jgi:hypothetical protein
MLLANTGMINAGSGNKGSQDPPRTKVSVSSDDVTPDFTRVRAMDCITDDIDDSDDEVLYTIRDRLHDCIDCTPILERLQTKDQFKDCEPICDNPQLKLQTQLRANQVVPEDVVDDEDVDDDDVDDDEVVVRPMQYEYQQQLRMSYTQEELENYHLLRMEYIINLEIC